jgi:hypothetical protein
VTCEEASLQFHTTCSKCFETYGVAFKDPDAFHDHNGGLKPRAKEDSGVPQQDEATTAYQHADESMHDAAAGAEASGVGGADAATQFFDIDIYKVGVKDAADVKVDKKQKRKEFIKTLNIEHCAILESNNADGHEEKCRLVSIGGVPLSKLLLSDLFLFCSTNSINGYRQMKKEEVAHLIAAKVLSKKIYASIGRLGMTMDRDGSVLAPAAETGVSE